MLLTLLAACSSSLDMDSPVVDLYCDNFLIYDMCAQDLNRDGEVELVYFTDTREVFLYRDGALPRIPDELSMHRCAQMMDNAIITNTSRLFYISEETSYLERTNIRSDMMFSYISYIPRVAGCNENDQAAAESPPDDFDFEFDF